MTLAFPANDCGGLDVEAIDWPYLEEIKDCVLADAPAAIYDYPAPPFPPPVPYRLRVILPTTTTSDSASVGAPP